MLSSPSTRPPHQPPPLLSALTFNSGGLLEGNAAPLIGVSLPSLPRRESSRQCHLGAGTPSEALHHFYE